MTLTNEQKLEMTNDALLTKCDTLEKSVAYWREETDKAWETAQKWRKEAGAEAVADEQAERALWESAAESLWDLMDDIDTLSDAIRPRNEEGYAKFYRLTMELIKRRNDHIRHNESGGLSLVLPNT